MVKNILKIKTNIVVRIKIVSIFAPANKNSDNDQRDFGIRCVHFR